MRTVTEVAVGLEMARNFGAVGVGNCPPVPLKVTPPLNARARPFIVLVDFMVID